MDQDYVIVNKIQVCKCLNQSMPLPFPKWDYVTANIHVTYLENRKILMIPCMYMS